MKIRFIKDFPTSFGDIKIGDIYEVVSKKPADKHNGYIRYLIESEATSGAAFNVPEFFVEEIE